MALFNTEDYGKILDEKLSNHIKDFTNKKDYADVSDKLNISTSTIRDVVARYNPVTESNSLAIIELTKIAFDNCIKSIDKANESKKFLSKKIESCQV